MEVKDGRQREPFALVYRDELHAMVGWSSSDVRVYLALLTYCGGRGSWAVSWDTIADVAAVHRDTVRASVARFRKAGILATTARYRDGRQVSNEITIYGPGGVDRPSMEGGETTPPEGGETTPPRGGRVHPSRGG